MILYNFVEDTVIYLSSKANIEIEQYMLPKGVEEGV